MTSESNVALAKVALYVATFAALGTVAAGAGRSTQSPSATGHLLSGIVTDQQGLAIGGVEVSMHSLSASGTSKVKTDTSGLYEFAALPPGAYVVQARAPGFMPQAVPVFIESTDVQRDVQLMIGGVTETVTVTSPPDAGRHGTPRRAKRRKPPTCGTPPRGGEVVPPLKIFHVFPMYPQGAYETKRGGRVQLEAMIGADGRLTDLKVIGSTATIFDRPALDAVGQWEFDPAYLDCRAVSLHYQVEVVFSTEQGH